MKKFVFFVFSAFVLFACDKNNNNQTTPDKYADISIQPVYNNSNLYLDSVYTSAEGYLFKITDIKCFVTGLNNNGDTLIEAALFDYRETGTRLCQAKADYTKFSSLSGNIGVMSSLNHSDPSTYPNNSPLNISNAGPMHWGWNPGYIFFNIEGKADTIQDGTALLDHSFSFHIGTDTYLKNFNFTNLSWVKVNDNEYNLPLDFDFNTFFQSPGNAIDLKTEYLTHTAASQEALTIKVTENFKNALRPH